MSGFRRPYRPPGQQQEPVLHTAADLDRMQNEQALSSRTLNWLHQGYAGNGQPTYEDEVPQRFPFRSTASRSVPLSPQGGPNVYEDPPVRQPFQPVQQSSTYQQFDERHEPFPRPSYRSSVPQTVQTQQAIYDYQDAPQAQTRRFQPRSLDTGSRPVIRQLQQARPSIQPDMQMQQSTHQQPNYQTQAYEPDEEFYGDDDLDVAIGNLPATPDRSSNIYNNGQNSFPPPPQPAAFHHQPAPTASTSARPAVPSGPIENGTNRGAALKNGIRLKAVADLPDQYRQLFKFGVFNAVQSSCFDTLYATAQNVVISSPTGSGKTTLFELAMLRELNNAAPDQKVKFVYMAPTKALCSERVKDWTKRLQHLGQTVAEITGDMTAECWSLARKASLIVTTFEKFDSMTRSWRQQTKFFDTIRLVCIDEIHGLNDGARGATLEVVVSRIKTLGTNVRFVAASATVPNANDVATWIGDGGQPDVEQGQSIAGNGIAKVFIFGDNFRPVPLKKFVYGYPPTKNDFMFTASLNSKLMDLIKQHGKKKAVLIFCNTRNACVQVAAQIAKQYTEHSGQKPWAAMARPHVQFGNSKLQDFADAGVAFHHAGLSQEDRKAVEEGFLQGSIKVLVSTSTLAVGVNLPAFLVIICGTFNYAAGEGSTPYSDLDILQMMGRAGRPQFDTEGVVAIMTQQENKSRFEKLVNCQAPLESSLHKNLTEHLNSEISLKTITSIESAVAWLQNTFFYSRLQANPRYYGLDGTGTAQTADERLEELVLNNVQQLDESGILQQDEGTSDLHSTSGGEIMSRYCIKVQTFNKFSALNNCDQRTLLEAICEASEFEQITLRASEKQIYTAAAKRTEIRYAVPKVTTAAQKIMILIQLVLGAVPLGDLVKDSSSDAPAPSGQALLVWKDLSRLVRCVIDLACDREDGGTTKQSLELLRSVYGKAWDTGPNVMRQLSGIGEKSVSIKCLQDKGVVSISDVATSAPGRLELILNRNAPFGTKLRNQACAFPQFLVQLEIEDETPGENGVAINIKCTVGLKQDPRPAFKAKAACTVLLLTSDNVWLAFRRMRMDKILESEKTFSLKALLIRPSQKVVAYVACENIAGVEVRVVAQPQTDRAFYPVVRSAAADPMPPARSLSKAVVVKSVSQKTQPTQPEKPQPAPAKEPAKSKQTQSDTMSLTEQRPPQMLPNGNYRCGHPCKDRAACRHLCCKEGTRKPPGPKKQRKAPKNAREVVEPEEIDELEDDDDNEADIITLSTVKPPTTVKSSASTKANVKESQLDRILAELDDADETMEESPAESQTRPKRFKAKSISRAAPTLDDFLPDVHDLPPIAAVGNSRKDQSHIDQAQLGSEEDDLNFDLPLEDAFAFAEDMTRLDKEADSATLDSSPLRAYSPVKQKKRLLSLSPAPRKPGSKKARIVLSSDSHAEPFAGYSPPAQSRVEDIPDVMQLDVEPNQPVVGPEPALFQPESSQTAVEELVNDSGAVEEEDEGEDVQDFLTWLENNVQIVDG